jgi:phage gpG-like protein
MARLKTEFDSPEAFQRFLRKARRHYSEGDELTGRVAGFLRSSTIRRIKGGNLGQENADVTKAVKQGSTPLQDTGAFQQSITSLATDSAAIVGSPLKYAAPLQTGAEITPTSAEKLAFPAGQKTRTLQRRYGFDFERLISGMQEDGWDVWFMENAVMANNPESADDPFPLLVRKDKVTIPEYKPFRIDEGDEDDILGIMQAWISEPGNSF